MRLSRVQVGKLKVSIVHLKCFRFEELRQIVGEKRAKQLLARAARHLTFFTPVRAELIFEGGRLTLSPGLTFVSRVSYSVSGAALSIADELMNDEFLWNILVELPQKLEEERLPVIVKDLDERFSRYVSEGVLYALDIMERIAKVYKVPFIISGSLKLWNVWSWLHTVVKVKGEDGETIILVDGEPWVMV